MPRWDTGVTGGSSTSTPCRCQAHSDNTCSRLLTGLPVARGTRPVPVYARRWACLQLNLGVTTPAWGGRTATCNPNSPCGSSPPSSLLRVGLLARAWPSRAPRTPGHIRRPGSVLELPLALSLPCPGPEHWVMRGGRRHTAHLRGRSSLKSTSPQHSTSSLQPFQNKHRPAHVSQVHGEHSASSAGPALGRRHRANCPQHAPQRPCSRAGEGSDGRSEGSAVRIGPSTAVPPGCYPPGCCLGRPVHQAFCPASPWQHCPFHGIFL